MTRRKLQLRESIETVAGGPVFRGERVVMGTRRLDQYVIFKGRCVKDPHDYDASDRDEDMLRYAQHILWEIATGNVLDTCDPGDFGL